MSDHRWYILGAGAIGCLWAAYWRQAGIDVVLITPTARTTSTLELSNWQGKKQFDIQAVTIDELITSDTPIDKLLVSTKAQHTIAAIAAIKNNINRQATVLVLQNGMAVKKLPELLPTQTLVTGITTDGAYRTDPLSVIHAGRGETFIGCDRPPSPVFLSTLLHDLPSQFLTIKACNDIEIRQWQKLGINCAINGLTVIYQCRNGELLDNPAAMQRIQAVCAEILAVTKSLGLSEHLTDLPAQVVQTLRATAENYSSMYQDIAKGQSTEIDCINGYLCELADELSIRCEENKRITKTVKQREQLTPASHRQGL